eukprot:scaffold409_cov23-Prasinocladus_malaysianus.AAC.2
MDELTKLSEKRLPALGVQIRTKQRRLPHTTNRFPGYRSPGHLRTEASCPRQRHSGCPARSHAVL